jgi:hypothetical protein
MAGSDEESGLRARLSSILGLRTARIYRPVTGPDEPAIPPPGRAGASPPGDDAGQDDAAKGEPGSAP